MYRSRLSPRAPGRGAEIASAAMSSTASTRLRLHLVVMGLDGMDDAAASP